MVKHSRICKRSSGKLSGIRTASSVLSPATETDQLKPEQDVPYPSSSTTSTFRDSHFSQNFSQIPVSHRAAPWVQPKLTVGSAGGYYEQEADRVATQVVSQADPATNISSVHAPPFITQLRGESDSTLQRQPAAEEEKKKEMAEDKIEQAETKKQQAEKEKIVEEEKVIEAEKKKKDKKRNKVQTKAQSGQTPTVTPALANHLDGQQGRGQSLSPGVRQVMEHGFHRDFSQVRVRTDHEAAETLHAKAFTHGQTITFNTGQYQPDSPTGKHLLAHELAHVVQQDAAPEKPRSMT